VRILLPKREGVIEGWKRPHNEELHNWYSLPDIIRMIRSKRMRQMGHVASMEEKRDAYRFLV
jgi:hypothetical protein